MAIAGVLPLSRSSGDVGEREVGFDELSTDGYRSLLTLANSAMASSGVGSAHGSWRSISFRGMMVPIRVVVVPGQPAVLANQGITGLAGQGIEVDGDQRLGVQLGSAAVVVIGATRVIP